MTNRRSRSGSIAAEYVAALVFLFLVLVFPLINIATVAYRYNLMVAAVHAAAHAGAVAPKFVSGTDSATAVIPAIINNYLGSARGITIQGIRFRINETPVITSTVTNHNFGAQLTAPATIESLYSVEVVVTASVSPLVPLSTGFIPAIPGFTAPAAYTVASQELVETTSGLNQ